MNDHVTQVTQGQNVKSQHKPENQVYNAKDQYNDVTQSSDVLKDNRLAPKPRKLIELWQCYLWWHELVEIRKKHTLRIKAVKRGKSNMSVPLEEGLLEMLKIDQMVDPKNKKEKSGSIFQMMVDAGKEAGPIWDWLNSHHGIGESLAAQILAHVDDIANFDSIAKLWRYTGYGIFEYWVDEKGKAVCPKEGWKWIKIKGNMYRVWTVTDHISGETQREDVNSQHPPVTQGQSANNQEPQVTQSSDVKSQSVNVTHIEYAIPPNRQYALPQNDKLKPIKRVDFLEPDPAWTLKKMSDRLCPKYHSPFNRLLKAVLWNVTEQFIKGNTPYYRPMYDYEKTRLREKYPKMVKVNGKKRYNDGHINDMAKRKIRKEFLKQLWLKWREFEGLPITEEWKG